MSASFALSKRASARSIAVIGGGASGALIAAHLLKCADDDVHLTLIEPRAQIGRGLAYATENESHRLNVRASNMSAFPDDPDHFWRWLRASGHAGEDRFCFVPRLVYGRYLASLIEDRLTEPEAGRLRWLRKTVVGLKEHDGSVVLRFSSRETAAFDVAILCCGHEPSEHLAAPAWRDPRAWNGAPEFDDSDPRDRAHDGRRRHLAERGGSARTDCCAVAARPFASGPSPGRDRANCANGTAVAGEACGVPALASREGAE